jgi:thymidine phosphorylase
MLLKVNLLGWSAGGPVAMINSRTAVKLGVHIDGRIMLYHNSHQAVVMVDISDTLVKDGVIILSQEAAMLLNAKKSAKVRAVLTTHEESIDLIHKKLSCTPLNYSELEKIMKDITNNVLVGAEIAYFVSAIYRCGMSLRETVDLTRAMVNTGKSLHLKNKLIVDKHSIGGIPGRLTPIVVSICAAAGLTMPKTSSRAITSPAGTADCMEVLCKVSFSPKQLEKIVSKTGACFVWGGTLGFAPADDKLIKIEKMMHLDPEAQLLASILSKKLSVGAKHALIDIPYGPSAKVYDKKKAIALKNKFETIGKKVGIKIHCFLSFENEPRGNGIGPLLEARDVVQVLEGKSNGYKLRKLSIKIAGLMLEMVKKAAVGKGEGIAREILDSGKAHSKFNEIIVAQGGSLKNLDNLKLADYSRDIIAKKKFKVSSMDIKRLNQVAIIAGCPSSKAAGIYLYKHLGDVVAKGEKIITIYAETKSELKEAVDFYNKANPIN